MFRVGRSGHRFAAFGSIVLVFCVVININLAEGVFNVTLPSSDIEFLIYRFIANNVNGNASRSAGENLAAYQGRESIHGLRAAFDEINRAGGIHGRNLSAVVIESSSKALTSSDLQAEVLAGLMSNPSSMGYVLSEFFSAPYTFELGKAFGKPDIGSTTAYTKAFQATASGRASINLRQPFELESKMFVQYSTQSSLRCRTHGVLYYDSPEVLHLALGIRDLLVSIAYEAPVLVPISFTDAKGFEANVTKYIKPGNPMLRPQCLMILMDTDGLVGTLDLLATVPSFDIRDYALICPSVVQSGDFTALSGYTEGSYDRLSVVSQFPHPEDTRYLVSINYRNAMAALHAQPGVTPVTPRLVRSNTNEPWTPNAFSHEAYIVGRFVGEVLKSMNPRNITGHAFVDRVYAQKFFSVDDYSFGPYSDGCPGNAKTTSQLACECNSGARRMFMTKFNTTTARLTQVVDDPVNFEVGVEEYPIPLIACTAAQVAVVSPPEPPSIHVIITADSASKLVKQISQTFSAQMYGNVEAMRQLGLPYVDLDIVRVTVPAGTEITNETYAQALPSYFQLQGTLGFAVDDPDTLFYNTTASFPTVAPLRYYYRETEPPLPPMDRWIRNYFPVFPVLADYAYTLVRSALLDRHAKNITIVADTDSLAKIVRRAAHTFQHDPHSATVLFTDAAWQDESAAANIHPSIKTVLRVISTCTNAELILASQSLPVLTYAYTQMLANKKCNFSIVSSDFAIYRSSVQLWAQRKAGIDDGTNVQPPADLADHVYYATPLKSFAEAGYAFPDPAQYFSAALAGFTYMTSGSLFRNNISAAAYTDALFGKTFVGPSFGEALLGPLSDDDCGFTDAVADHPPALCQCTKGFARFHVRRFAAWANATYFVLKGRAQDWDASADTVLSTYIMSDCGHEWKELQIPFELSAEEIVATVLVAAAASCCIIGGLFKLVRSQQRDNTYAPKDPKKPFAIAFTDIQSSTTMWACAPNQMGPAVDKHHEVIRQVIAECRGYEVKTIGDSFMVAFQDPRDAVRFGLCVQSRLFDADWGSDIFDTTYDELIKDAHLKMVAQMQLDLKSADSTPTAVSKPTASPGLYSRSMPTFESSLERETQERGMWKGLRVRVGIHFGLGEIKLDRVSKGYDYYGTVVNTAARVEGVAHGGQTCITRAVFDAITKDGVTVDVAEPCITHDFGPQHLRGLNEPVTLLQLLPQRFTKRSFPPLRLDVERDIESDSESETHDAADDTGTAINKSEESVRSHQSQRNLTVDDLIAHLVNRSKPPTERVRQEAFQGLKLGYTILDTLFRTSTAKFRDATIKHFDEKWRIEPLRKKPSMKKFKQQLRASDLSLVLIASRVTVSAQVTVASESTEHETVHSASEMGANSSFQRPPGALRKGSAASSGTTPHLAMSGWSATNVVQLPPLPPNVIEEPRSPKVAVDRITEEAHESTSTRAPDDKDASHGMLPGTAFGDGDNEVLEQP